MAIPVTLATTRRIVEKELHHAYAAYNIVFKDKPEDKESLMYFEGKIKTLRDLTSYLIYGIEPGYGA